MGDRFTDEDVITLIEYCARYPCLGWGRFSDLSDLNKDVLKHWSSGQTNNFKYQQRKVNDRHIEFSLLHSSFAMKIKK